MVGIMLEDADVQQIRKKIISVAEAYNIDYNYACDIADKIIDSMFKLEDKLSLKAALKYAKLAAHGRSTDHLNKIKETEPVDFEENSLVIGRYLSDDTYNPQKPLPLVSDEQKETNELLQQLPAFDRKLILLYEKKNRRITEVAKVRNQPYNTVKEQIRLAKSRLDTLKKRKQGLKATKGVLHITLEEAVMRIINKFIYCLAHDCLQKLKRYFSDEEISRLPKLNIKEYDDFDITTIGEKEYRLFVYYRDYEDNLLCYIMDFKETNKHVPIAITNLPEKPGRSRGYDKSQMHPDDVAEITKTDPVTGCTLCSDARREEILSKYKPIFVFEDEEEGEE
jgi:DNA-directed RNA polymerase specialized sigma24 family protein